MKKLLIVCIVVSLFGASAFAQTGPAGHIGIYADAAGTECSLVDVPGTITFYVVYVNHAGTPRAWFAAPKPDCLAGVWIGDDSPFPNGSGDSQTGVMVVGDCQTSPTLLYSITYSVTGTTPDCCVYPILPHPDVVEGGAILANDCDLNYVEPSGGQAIINPNGTCLCSVPTEDSTWGKIKELYR